MTKVEPWNSVKVTVSIPVDAADKLKKLALSNSVQLHEMGISAIQLEGLFCIFSF